MYPNGAAIPPILPKPPSRSPTRTHRGEGFPVPGPLLAPAPRPPDRGPIAGPSPRPSAGQAGRGSGRPTWPAQPPAQPQPPPLAAYGAATAGPTSAATPPPPPQQPRPAPPADDNGGPSTPRRLSGQTSSSPAPLAPPDDGFPASAYNYGTWTAADDRTLLAARARGQHWAELQAAHFPAKTANACRKRHERLMERRGAHDSAGDARRFERIASEYMAMRREIWGGLAERVKERWEFVEKECLNARLPKLQSNARSYTNRYRRESRSGAGSQKTPHPAGTNSPNNPSPGLPPHLLHTGGVPGLGPVTTMGMISPVEDEFHIAGVGAGPGPAPGHGQTFLGSGGGGRRSAEIMPPPPPPPSAPLGGVPGVQFGGTVPGGHRVGMGRREGDRG
ncbi:hypothetical protein QBC39DRAFT_333035 [Podospora conica]|nr:hypothetical protein QBC39DRAFT_333035 [Schizothecium conicum]